MERERQQTVMTEYRGQMKLTKARLKQERAHKVYARAEAVALKARLEWEYLWFDYLDEAERQGLCRVCLQPENAGCKDHILLAAASRENSAHAHHARDHR